MNSDESSWQSLLGRRFTILLEQVSSTVGEVVRVGQWLHTREGMAFHKECLQIAEDGLGEAAKGTRVASSWACGILAARMVKENS